MIILVLCLLSSLLYLQRDDSNDQYKIKYEQIVQDFDHTVTKLLSFLELEWSDNVKEFYKMAEKRGIINTPSYRQINQPLYKKSIERWKNYEGEFSEVKQILDKWKQIFNY